MKKIIVTISAIVVVLATMNLWNTNHGFIAFINAIVSGIILSAGVALLFDKDGDHSSKAVVMSLIAVAISVTLLAMNTEDPVAVAAAAKVEATAKEKARLDAMTPEERDREVKQKAFESERTIRGYLLTQQIKAAAFDPDALKIKSPEYFKNGVCVSANGKNRFGAYVGWKEYCYLVNDKGVWTLQE
jgi:hypothetical protein